MATVYKNILLKDNTGKALLPITLSYYVEYKGGVSVQSYLDTLSGDLNNVNSYIDTINTKIAQNGEVQQNIINSINEVLESYVQKPDHTALIAFDNTYAGLSTALSGLVADTENNVTYVTAQQAIVALDAKLESAYTYLNTVEGRVSTAESDIDALETSVSGIDSRVTDAENAIDALEEKVNPLFDNGGNLALTAEHIIYEGKAAAGTSNAANVQTAIDTIGIKLEGFNATMEAIEAAAGVTYVTGVNGVLINGENDSRKQGSVVVSLNLGQNGKLTYNSTDGSITVDESKLDLTNVTTYASNISGKIQTSQIEGGLDANNINITYSYMGEGDVLHNDGEKSLQDFYNETDTTLSELKTNVANSAISVTSADDTTYARVYTITQGSTSYTINIPKDQFLKNVEYVDAYNAPAGAAEGDYPALVFTWNLSDEDDSTDAPTSIVPISSFVDSITSEIASDVTELQTRVSSIENAGYITGVTLDGVAGTNVNGVINLTSYLQFDEGTSTEIISNEFLSMHGLASQSTEPEPEP